MKMTMLKGFGHRSQGRRVPRHKIEREGGWKLPKYVSGYVGVLSKWLTDFFRFYNGKGPFIVKRLLEVHFS